MHRLAHMEMGLVPFLPAMTPTPSVPRLLYPLALFSFSLRIAGPHLHALYLLGPKTMCQAKGVLVAPYTRTILFK